MQADISSQAKLPLFRLNQAEQAELQARMEKRQMKDFMSVCTQQKEQPCLRDYYWRGISVPNIACRCTANWSTSASTTVSMTSQASPSPHERKAAS